MAGAVSDPGMRARLVARIERMRSGPVESGPLTWGDISFLVHGMAFAPGPLKQATGAVTARYYLGTRGIWILNLISIGIAHPHELAEMLRVGRSLVSYELTQLTKAGLICSRKGKLDRRHSELSLTPEGEAAFRQVQANLEQFVRETLGHYSPEELRLCSRILADLHRASDEEIAPGDLSSGPVD